MAFPDLIPTRLETAWVTLVTVPWGVFPFTENAFGSP